jgi:hypothetical protein
MKVRELREFAIALKSDGIDTSVIGGIHELNNQN